MVRVFGAAGRADAPAAGVRVRRIDSSLLRRRWVFLFSASFVLMVVLVAGFPSVVRWRVGVAAERAGLVVEVASVRPGWGRLWLRGVEVKSLRIKGARARIDAVEVDVGFGGAEAVIARGGAVRIDAGRQELVEAFRDRGSGSGGVGSKRRLRGEGLFVQWAPGEGESVVVWGAAFERSPEGVSAAADLVEVEHPVGAVRAKGVRATLDGHFKVKTASAKEASVALEFERLLEAMRTHESTGPGAPTSGAPPAVQGALPKGPVWAGAARLPSIDVTRGARLAARSRQLAGLVSRRLPAGAAVELAGVTVRLAMEGGGVTLGPAQFRVEHEPKAVSVEFAPTADARVEHRLSMTAQLPIESGESRLELAGGPVRLSALGIREGDLGLQRVNEAELEIRAGVTLSEDGARVLGSSTGRVEGLAISRPAFGRLPLEGLSFGWDVKGAVATDGSSFSIDSGEFNIGAVRIETSASVQQTADNVAVNVRLEVPLGSCSDMLGSLPRNLVPFASELRMGGTFSWRTALRFDSQQLSDMDLEWKMQDDCRFERVPDDLSPNRFRGPFSREVPDADGFPIRILTGPGSEQWAPLPEISRFMEAAVLVSEDGRFWSHKGFDQRAIESSIRQNVEAGRFMRGASTISMQLAKNLYLTREKTLSRKVQEALLTMLLEQELRKDEILELYFNVIELGPGIYGVRQGAKHYFNSTPADLSVAQAFFLATLLPSPRSQHFDESGSLKPNWRRYVDRLMRIAAERQRISEADLEVGLAEEVRFGVPANPDGSGFQPGPPDSVTGDPVPF